MFNFINKQIIGWAIVTISLSWGLLRFMNLVEPNFVFNFLAIGGFCFGFYLTKNANIKKEVKMTKLSIETFEDLKQKYGGHSSWAVWAEETDKPKSNMEDLSIFENIEILEVLKPEIILVALNFSVDIEIKLWENFHGKNGEVYKLRYALKNTPLWGAYMTDIIVDHVDPSANSMMKHLINNPDVVIENIKRFENEIKDLNADNLVLYALGNDVFEILNNNLSDKYKIKQITHYASRINKETYKDKVWKQLQLKN
jgi:hypothetical protein